MQPEFQMLFSVLTGDDTFSDMSEERRREIQSALPEGLTMQREAVVMAAYSLVGNMKYFWGGKYPQIGIHPLWGVERVVASPNSETYGSIRPYGMDCSGFVQWVFVNAAKDENIAALIGGGTSTQWSNTVSLGWDEAQPGDLAFFRSPGSKNHVGVVVEKREDGSYMVAHCSSSQNNVVVTEAWETGFRYMRRPILYGEE
jgi:cell wall-associated NlpC family hydrolase